MSTANETTTSLDIVTHAGKVSIEVDRLVSAYRDFIDRDCPSLNHIMRDDVTKCVVEGREATALCGDSFVLGVRTARADVHLPNADMCRACVMVNVLNNQFAAGL